MQTCRRAPGRLSPIVLHTIQLNTNPWSIHKVQLSIFILNNGEARRIAEYFNLCFAYVVLVHQWFAALEPNLLYAIAFTTPSPCWQGYDELGALFAGILICVLNGAFSWEMPFLSSI